MLIGAASLALGGCLDRLASVSCAKIKSEELHVGAGQTCRFPYGGGDVARYVVVVTRPPAHGVATGEGKYLRYEAKPGFVGEDRVGIKIERRGVGHVQWQNLTVRVKIGPAA